MREWRAYFSLSAGCLTDCNRFLRVFFMTAGASDCTVPVYKIFLVIAATGSFASLDIMHALTQSTELHCTTDMSTCCLLRQAQTAQTAVY